MGSVEVFTKTRMLAIENSTVVDGAVDLDGHLILQQRDGTPIDAGDVRAPNLADASTTVKGIVQLATGSETIAGVENTKAITPAGLQLLTATELRRGIIELATEAEVMAGVDTIKAVTAAHVKAARTSWEGTVSPSWTFGKPDVTLSDGSIVSAFLPANDVDVQPSSSVILNRTPGDIWTIVAVQNSNPAFLRQISVVGMNGWESYYDSPQVAEESRFGRARVTKSSTGWVVCAGLIKAGPSAILTAGTTIAILPLGMRPIGGTLKFAAHITGSTTSVHVTTAGEVKIQSAATAAGYVSLSNIVFNTDLVKTTMMLTTALPSLDTSFSPPTYAKDSYGVISLEGVIRSASYDLRIWTPPSGYELEADPNANVQYHLITASGAGLGYVHMQRPVLKSRTSVDYNSLSLTTLYPAVGHSLVWNPITTLEGGWVNLAPANYGTPAWAERPDGLIQLRGMFTGGAIGSSFFTLPEGCRPKSHIIRTAITNQTAGRLDIRSSGGVVPLIGSNSWFSINGSIYAPEK